jgi:bifunctional UDP-N-acetylglucosamine pyrophosphorylase/glucosamine-1-phosphate N-acetyltransferase
MDIEIVEGTMSQLKAVILAAGKGTRMKSDLPKVVHTIEGKCLVDYAIEAAKGAGADDICLVVGYKADVVKTSIAHQDVTFVLQEEQLGTGHAVMCARDFLGTDGMTLILFGDTPLITAQTLQRLKQYHEEHHNTVTVLSAMIDDPSGYGRIIRDADGVFVKSVEDKDATEAERKSHEINSGMYLFDTAELASALGAITPNNAQGEYYLPDTLTVIKDKGLRVDAYTLDDPEDITGVNDQEQLKEAAVVIRRRQKRNETCI